MANRNLASADMYRAIPGMGDSLLAEIGGSVRRITIEKLMKAINRGDTQLLHSIAWGVPLRQNQSNPYWELFGNSNLWMEYVSRGGRYMVTGGGMAAKLSTDDFGLFADGTVFSDDTIGHVMVIFPDLYYTLSEASGEPVLWMSMVPIGERCIKRPVIGAYKGSMSGSALVSRMSAVPATNKTITEFWNAAQQNGRNWGLTSYDHRLFMMMLALSGYQTPNVQVPNPLSSKTYYGVTGTGGSMDAVARAMITGATAELGDGGLTREMFTWTTEGGTRVDDASHVNLYGIEDPWGWLSEVVQGVYCGSSANSGQDGTEVFIYEGNRMPSSAELAGHPSGTYRQLTRALGNGFVKEMNLDWEFSLVPSVIGGDGTGSNSYWCDYTYSGATGQLFLAGGNAQSHLGAGLACTDMNNGFNLRSENVSARLAYYGDIEFVDGKDML